MKFWEYISNFQRLCEKGLDNGFWYVFGAICLIIIFIVALFFGIALWKGDPVEKVSDAYKAITSDALPYCQSVGFNNYRLVGREKNTNEEDKQAENLTFECFNSENVTLDVKKYIHVK